MCGFTGFYTISHKRSRNEGHGIIRAMADVIAHRGPDHGDVWQDPDAPLALGHRRLSILDLSAHGHQPMVSQADRYVIVFNGEIYNHLELRARYLTDHIFAGHSDTETLLALVEALGLAKTLDIINGMFAFALWDRRERVLHFARDRHGKKPLYVGWAGDALVFGSELKALRAHPDFKAEIDREAFALYTQYNCIPAPYCIYDGVWQLQPGHVMSVDVSALSAGADLREAMACYWSAAEAIAPVRRDVVSSGGLVDAFGGLLGECVRDRMLSDVPLGAFLSGGIDSSAVVALMQAQSDTPVHTYTIGFDEAGFDEAVYAREIAQHLGTDHHEHYCRASDAMAVIPKLPDMFDEPFADQSAIPTYLVAEFARRDVSVALSGDGGDEMLGGYSRHVSTPKIAALPPATKYLIDAVPPALLKTLFPTKPLLAKHLKKASRVLSAKTREEMYRVLLGNWECSPVLTHTETKLPLTEADNLELAEQLMLWDAQHYLPHDILTKVDRTSMAVSLEARAPLLDRRIYDFAWSLPLDYKIRNGQGKWLLREVLARHVPRAMFERPKQGFGVPVAQWLRGEMRDWAEDLLDENTLKAQGLYDVAAVRGLWADHLTHGHRHCDGLWNILMFQAWHRRWMG